MEHHLHLVLPWYDLVVGLQVQGLGFGVYGSGFGVGLRLYRALGGPYRYCSLHGPKNRMGMRKKGATCFPPSRRHPYYGLLGLLGVLRVHRGCIVGI